MLGLPERHLAAELMDDPALAADAHRAALSGLARINRVSLTAHVLWSEIERRLPGCRALRVLDVACGGGDVAVALAKRAHRRNVQAHVEGRDVSPVAVAEARARARHAGVPVTFQRADIVSEPLPDDFDVILSTLFLHHLPRPGARALLAAMGRAARALVLVDDLVRGAPGLTLATVAPRLLSRSTVVHVDAVRSIRAAFTPDEARSLAEAAGLRAVHVRRHWPCRYLISAEPAG